MLKLFRCCTTITINNTKKHFQEDLHLLFAPIYTHRVSGSQQYKRARAGIEICPVSVCFLSRTFSLARSPLLTICPPKAEYWRSP